MKRLNGMCSQLRKPHGGFRKVLRVCPQNTNQLQSLRMEPAETSLEPSRTAPYWVVGGKWSYCFSGCWKILGKNVPSVACVVYDSTPYPSTFMFVQTSSGHQVKTGWQMLARRKGKKGCCSAIQIEYNPLGDQEVPLLSLFIILEGKKSDFDLKFPTILCSGNRFVDQNHQS